MARHMTHMYPLPHLFDIRRGQAMARPSGILCSAIATLSLSPSFAEPIVLIATAMPSGRLCAYIYIYIYIYMNIYIHTHTHTHILPKYIIHTQTHTHRHTHALSFSHMHTHTQTHTDTHALAHTHTDTHTHITVSVIALRRPTRKRRSSDCCLSESSSSCIFSPLPAAVAEGVNKAVPTCFARITVVCVCVCVCLCVCAC